MDSKFGCLWGEWCSL